MNEVQIGVRLPVELRDRLKEVANASGNSLSEEIRRRLEASFEEAASAPAADDPETTKLLKRITEMTRDASYVNEQPWHKDPLANAVLRAALPMLVPVAAGEPKAIEGRFGWTIYSKPDGSFPEPDEIARGWVAAIFSAEKEQK
jgi:predicted DNA-binding protein